MRPEEKEWWRKKNHEDYKKAQKGFVDGQSKGGGGCLVLVLVPSATILGFTIVRLWQILS